MTSSTHHIVSTRNNRNLITTPKRRIGLKNLALRAYWKNRGSSKRIITDTKSAYERAKIRHALKLSLIKDRIVAGVVVLIILSLSAWIIYIFNY